MAAGVLGVVGSGWALVAVAVFVTCAEAGSAPLSCTVSVKAAVTPAVRLLAAQMTAPVLPTLGDWQFQPTGEVSDWNVLLTDRVSVRRTVVARAGPVLVTASV